MSETVPMAFSWKTEHLPILALAPMAGYTDSSFRQLVKLVAPSAICFTEFTSADGIRYGSRRTLEQVEYNPALEHPIVAQIFGKKPENFFYAAKVLTEMNVDAIDINMGCPAKKVVSSDHGSALLKNPSLAYEILQATIEGTDRPVSLKTRIGIDEYDPDFFIPFCQEFARRGAALITIHGRTAKQMYTGKANWEPMYEVKRNVNIPVIGNGDVASAEDALAKLGNLDGVMVGRSTFGNPWVMMEILAALRGTPYSPPQTLAEKIPLILKHCELSIGFKGETRGLLEMRKHLAWYVKGFPGAGELRKKLVQVNSMEEIRNILESVK
ncbi:MAG: tRNA-dihydrouridine synthase [Candidatus Peregrinibacteria bacterium GW2011_GWA2_47_7]|nr:MAG: tRNA-dihydrouridine synthase [Candidatus Peregrinibacteria bacterium GW2011_GWA2_47_7]